MFKLCTLGVYKIVFPNGYFYIGSAYGKKGLEIYINYKKES